MPELLDHIAFFSQEIGPRPAGTEEEQQAALYIAEFMQKEAGLSAVIEDFNSEAGEEGPKAVCALLAFAITLLAVFFPILAIPSLVVTFITAILFVLESFDRSVLRRFARGVSQNIVARYEPGYSPEAGGARRRKIVLVANYDSGKVRPELNGPLLGILAPLRQASLGAMVFVPVFLLVRYLFFLHAEGVVAIILNTITGIALAFLAYPILLAFVHKFAAYNEAANCNASGVAVLLEVARWVGQGQASTSGAYGQAARTATVYGEETARSLGLVPEGARLVYEAAQVQAPTMAPQTEEERLAAAKAAIAAMTGHPVSAREETSVASNLVRADKMPDRAYEHEEGGMAAYQGSGGVSPGAAQQGREGLAGYGAAQAGQPYQAAQAVQAAQAGQTASQEASLQMQPQGFEAENASVGYSTGEPGAAGDQSADAQAGSALPPVDETPAVPEWFRKAQENAKRPKDGNVIQVQRSRYADALDAAAIESASFFNKANRVVNTETEERLKKMRDEIMEVSAPQLPHDRGAQQASLAVPQGASASPAYEGGNTVAMPPVRVDELRVPPQQGEQALQGLAGTASSGFQEAQAPPRNSIAHTIPALSVPDIGIQQQAATESGSEAARQPRVPIVLPDIEPSMEVYAQEETKSRFDQLPSIDPTQAVFASEEADDAFAQAAQPQASPRPDLRSLLPSLSGPIQNVSQNTQPTLSTPLSTEVTGALPPIGDMSFHEGSPEDLYLHDVDDEEGFTESGAYTGSDYMEMPQSRVRQFFGKLGFRKDKEKDEEAVQEWRDADEGFSPRQGSASYTDWDDYDQEGYEGFPQEEEDGYSSWRGGAFSRARTTAEDEPDDMAAGARGLAAADGRSQRTASEEMRHIYQFRHPDLDTEIWFVALGSELANCGGMRAFLAEHEQDLRGSIIVGLRALGSGELCFIEKEGTSGAEAASSRMRRYVKKAAQSLGINVESASIPWMTSATAIATKKGFQAMSIAGMDGSKPARFAQGDDVLENIDEAVLQQNTDFVMELLKNI